MFKKYPLFINKCALLAHTRWGPGPGPDHALPLHTTHRPTKIFRPNKNNGIYTPIPIITNYIFWPIVAVVCRIDRGVVVLFRFGVAAVVAAHQKRTSTYFVCLKSLNSQRAVRKRKKKNDNNNNNNRDRNHGQLLRKNSPTVCGACYKHRLNIWMATFWAHIYCFNSFFFISLFLVFGVAFICLTSNSSPG